MVMLIWGEAFDPIRALTVQKLLNDVACYKSFIWETYDLIVVLLVLGDALLCKD